MFLAYWFVNLEQLPEWTNNYPSLWYLFNITIRVSLNACIQLTISPLQHEPISQPSFLPLFCHLIMTNIRKSTKIKATIYWFFIPLLIVYFNTGIPDISRIYVSFIYFENDKHTTLICTPCSVEKIENNYVCIIKKMFAPLQIEMTFAVQTIVVLNFDSQ